MDLIKTLLVYMMMVISAATEASPALTPPPADALPTVTPYVSQAPTHSPIPTAVPTATPTPYTTLYVGDRGNDVKKLQRRLSELGYLNDTIDGVYGQNTKKAVERFQYYNNLKVDGIAGKATQALLFESTAVVTAPPNITQGATARPTATVPSNVIVSVYYMNEDDQLLRRVDMTCYGTTTIYANNDYAGADYVLASANAVTVSIQNGQASPESVTFRYQKRLTPTPVPTAEPTLEPTVVPTEEPTAVPTVEPTAVPTEAPTIEPTVEPTAVPTEEPTVAPTEEPTAVPTEEPTVEPTVEPTAVPTEEPTVAPTEEPTAVPTEEPTAEPTIEPTAVPTEEPTVAPTEEPTAEPTGIPAGLIAIGNTLNLNGNLISFTWYQDEDQQPMLSLKILAAALDWDYAPGADCSVWGHEILAAYDGGGISMLTIDGQSQIENARIWEGDLYVNLAFLQALGADTSASGDTIIILSPQ